MGYRAVVILNCDLQHVWSRDCDLGWQIARAVSFHSGPGTRIEPLQESGLGSGTYGYTVQCVHADTQSLVYLDSLSSDVVAEQPWSRAKSNEEAQLELLKDAAAKLGYVLRKKNSK